MYSRLRVWCGVLVAVGLGTLASYGSYYGGKPVEVVGTLGDYSIDSRVDRELDEAVVEGSMEVARLHEHGAVVEGVPGKNGLYGSAPRRVEVEAGGAVDDEWRGLPRLSFDLATHVRVSSELKAELFLRHEELNPRDVVMSEDARHILQVVLGNVSTQLKRLRDSHANLGTREAMAVVQLRGDDLPFTMGRHEVVVDKNGDEEEMRFFKVSTGDVLLPRPAGGAYRIAEKLLPGATLARDKRKFLLIELVVGMVVFFETQGTLSPEEARRVRENVLEGLMK
jgi:hypothetical protein